MEYITSRLIEKILFYKEKPIPDNEYLLSDEVTEQISNGEYPDIIMFMDFIDHIFTSYQSIVQHKSIKEFVSRAMLELMFMEDTRVDDVEELEEAFKKMDYYEFDEYIKSEEFSQLDITTRCLACLSFWTDDIANDSRLYIKDELSQVDLPEVDQMIVKRIIELASDDEMDVVLSLSESIFDRCYGYNYDIQADIEVLQLELDLITTEIMN